MLNRLIGVFLGLEGILAANVALAHPGFGDEAPRSSVDACVAEGAAKADYAEARSVLHDVQTEERRVSGHKMSIRTIVYGDGDTIIREYASHCAIDDHEEIRQFKIRQTGD